MKPDDGASSVAHLRWDLRQIFRMAVAEDFIVKNPAELLFVPRKCPRPNTRNMNPEQVVLLFSVLDLRELLIAVPSSSITPSPGCLTNYWSSSPVPGPTAARTTRLVEGKNGAVVRKHLGYGHIATEHADRIQRFYTAHFNPYLNYHRPCGFAQVRLDERGRRRRHYRTQDYATPYEKLRALPEAHRHLKDGMRWELLDRLAYAMSNTEAARRMMRTKAELLRQCKLESPFPPRFVC